MPINRYDERIIFGIVHHPDMIDGYDVRHVRRPIIIPTQIPEHTKLS